MYALYTDEYSAFTSTRLSVKRIQTEVDSNVAKQQLYQWGDSFDSTSLKLEANRDDLAITIMASAYSAVKHRTTRA